MKLRCIKKASYVGLSVGMAALIIFTALPYYVQTSLVFPSWSIYWNYAEVQTRMMWLFPGMAFLGAITTLGKRNTIMDVFINIAAPMTVLLAMRCLQYHYSLVIGILIFCVTMISLKFVDIFFEEKYQNNGVMKKIRVGYYYARKTGILFLLILLTPLTVWTARNEYYEANHYLTYWESNSKTDKYSENEAPVWDIVPQDQWDALTVDSRVIEFEKMVTYFLQDQNCGDVKVYAVKELTDGTLAYYSDYSESISVNVIYLNTCSYEEAIHVAAHECQHRQQHEIIHALDALEESGISCENNDYFKDAYALKEASDNYGLDSHSYTTYKNNLLEVKSEEYAEAMKERLREEGYLK